MYIYIKTLFIYLLYLCINICNYYYTVKKSFVYNTYVFHQMYILHVSYIIYVSNTYIYTHIIYTLLFQPARQSFGHITIAICFRLTPGDLCVHDLPRFFGRWGGVVVQLNLI